MLKGLDYEVVTGIDSDLACTSPLFEQMDTMEQVWSAAKKLREAIAGTTEIDPDFTLGAVIDVSTPERRHRFVLDVDSILETQLLGSVTLTAQPPQGISEEELVEWEAARAEQEYQAKLEAQLSKLEPVFREPRAAKVLTLMKREKHTGESLYKIYELAEGRPSTQRKPTRKELREHRKAFHAQFGVSDDEFKRFKDAVHNPVVSGDLARHAYEEPPKTTNPMTIREAETFVVQLAKRWLASVR